MKSIYTLVPDIYSLLKQRDGWFTQEISTELAATLAKSMHGHFNDQGVRKGLRLSRLGASCPRALWYSCNHPELAEPLPPQAVMKYSYGHVIEALALTLAKASGHEVVGEQDELSVDGVLGHRDAVVDGCIVDVKSTSTFGFQKFKDGSLANSDTFGYLEQLDGYAVGSYVDDLVRVKDKAYILAIDKTLGHMVLYEHTVRENSIRQRIESYKRLVALDKPPACECNTVRHGAAGNIALDTRASYSAFKHCCFPHLRTFIYATGPVYLTKVVRTPDVPEIHNHTIH